MRVLVLAVGEIRSLGCEIQLPRVRLGSCDVLAVHREKKIRGCGRGRAGCG